MYLEREDLLGGLRVPVVGNERIESLMIIMMSFRILHEECFSILCVAPIT